MSVSPDDMRSKKSLTPEMKRIVPVAEGVIRSAGFNSADLAATVKEALQGGGDVPDDIAATKMIYEALPPGAALDLAAVAVTVPAGAELGLNPASDALAVTVDGAALRGALVLDGAAVATDGTVVAEGAAINEQRGLEEFIRANPKEAAQLFGGLVKTNATLEKLEAGQAAGQAELKAVRAELNELKTGQAKLETGQKALVTQGEGIAKSVSFWPTLKVNLVVAAITVAVTAAVTEGPRRIVDFVHDRVMNPIGEFTMGARDKGASYVHNLFGSDLAKTNVPSPGLANVPVKAASLVLPNNPPSLQDVEYTERLWWFDKVDAEKRLQHPNDREFEARWSDTREGTSYALPVFATEKKSGTISSVNEKNVVQDLGDGKRITYRTEDLLYGLAGQERAEAFDRLKKFEHQAVELKVEARGFEAKPLDQLALQQVPEIPSHGAQAINNHVLER